MKIKYAVFILLVITSLYPIFSEPTAVSKELLLADIPVKYGDERFRERILERTGNSRKPVGLVLSGGSARAFAHIGVLKYLEQHNIVPDYIISNSMGSIIGLLYAAGLSPEQILEVCVSTPFEKLFDITFPLNGGLLDATKFGSLLKQTMGNISLIEETPIPIMIISEDLVTKRQIQIMEGDFYAALNASYALPVYYSPVNFKGHSLVDGGITNLVPIDAAYEYSDQVIVSTTFYASDELNLKNPITILNTSIDIGKRREGVKSLLNHGNAIWIRCDVEDVSFMAFDKIEYLSKKGYESAEKQAEELKPVAGYAKSNNLEATRQELQPIIDKSSKEYAVFEHVSLERPQNLLSLRLQSYDTAEGYNLFSDTSLAIKYNFAFKDVGFYAGAGVTSPLYIQDAINIRGFANAGFEFYPIYNLYFLIEGFALTDGEENDIFAAEALDYRLNWLNNRLSLSLFQKLEYNLLNNNFLLSGGAKAAYLNINDFVKLDARFRYLFDYDISEKLGRHFYDNLIGMKLHGDFVSFSASGFSRFDLDKNGRVPIFPGDALRISHPNLVTAEDHHFLIFSSFKLGFIPKNFTPGFGEFLIFKNSGVSLYADLLWKKSSFMPYFSSGIEFQTNTSLIGLKDIPLSFFIGYEYDYEDADEDLFKGFIWGMQFALKE